MITGILIVVMAYLLGSIPFAYILTRLVKGVDIRQVGTRNVGAMNTWREIGPLPGIAVLLLDMAKGSVPILVGQWLEIPEIYLYLAGFAAVAGHTWPAYLRFRGGRGAATTVGVLFTLVPLEFAISFAVIVVVVLITRNSGIGISAGLVLLPLLIWLFGEDPGLIIFSIALPLFLLIINFPMLKRDISEAHGLKNFILAGRPPVWRKREK